MYTVSIVIAVVDEDTGGDVGQFVLDTLLPSVPRASEWVHVAGEATRVQDVAWFLDDNGAFSHAEAFLSTRRVGENEPEALFLLKDSGFKPINQHGERTDWSLYETVTEAQLEEAGITRDGGVVDVDSERD